MEIIQLLLSEIQRFVDLHPVFVHLLDVGPPVTVILEINGKFQINFLRGP